MRTVAAGMVTQQQQHAERGAVQVSGVFEVYNVALRGAVDALVGIAKFLMRTEIEASLNQNGQLLPIG